MDQKSQTPPCRNCAELDRTFDRVETLILECLEEMDRLDEVVAGFATTLHDLNVNLVHGTGITPSANIVAALRSVGSNKKKD